MATATKNIERQNLAQPVVAQDPAHQAAKNFKRLVDIQSPGLSEVFPQKGGEIIPPSAATKLAQVPSGSSPARQLLTDVMTGLTSTANRAIAANLGGPVDLASMAMKPLGVHVNSPVGGSDWLGQKMEAAGLVTADRNPAAEALASLVGPAIAPKAAKMAGAFIDGASRMMLSGSGRPSISTQIGAISTEGKARLLADLTAGRGGGSYRLGDVTAGQASKLGELAGSAPSGTDVFMTDSVTKHLLRGRIKRDGFSPEDVANFAENALAARSAVRIDPSKANQHPSLINGPLRDAGTNRTYSAQMPLQNVDGGFEVRSVIPVGLKGPKSKTP